MALDPQDQRFIAAVESLQELLDKQPDAAKLAELETKVDYLYGNGKPGAVQNIFSELSQQKRMLHMAHGALILLGAELGIAIPFVLAHLWK